MLGLNSWGYTRGTLELLFSNFEEFHSFATAVHVCIQLVGVKLCCFSCPLIHKKLRLMASAPCIVFIQNVLQWSLVSVSLYLAVKLPPKFPRCCSNTSKFPLKLRNLSVYFKSILQRQHQRATYCKHKKIESVLGEKAST